MKNLITLYSTKINVNSGLFVKHLRCRIDANYARNYNKCCCPTILTQHLTSNCSYTSSTDNFKKNDTKKRFYSTNSGPPSTKLPPLMTFPEIMWPSLIKSIRNLILSTFIIKPYFDKEFNLPDFVRGSKQALEIVSSKISQGDVKNLEGLVTSDVVQSLQRSLALMSVFQREQIAVTSEDIVFSFPYQIGIIFNETDINQKRYVEITMVFHALRGLAAMRERGEQLPFNMAMMPEYQKRMSVCNYRFIREYTKGAE
ncbi:hypothetical protein AMK59_3667, partial [Oryctes borbonicus]